MIYLLNHNLLHKFPFIVCTYFKRRRLSQLMNNWRWIWNNNWRWIWNIIEDEFEIIIEDEFEIIIEDEFEIIIQDEFELSYLERRGKFCLYWKEVVNLFKEILLFSSIFFTLLPSSIKTSLSLIGQFNQMEKRKPGTVINLNIGISKYVV